MRAQGYDRPVPLDLDALVHPSHTALVTQECQRAVLGEAPIFPELAASAHARHMTAKLATIVTAARAAGVPVLHCVVARRSDNRGSNHNARVFVAAERAPTRLVEGSEAARVLPELGPEPEDFVVPRLHGVSPMHGTELDAILRNLGCTTVVGVGVSLNVAIANLAFDAVNLGYQMVVPRDAVAGVPAEYGDAVLEHTLPMVATVTDVEAVTGAWARASSTS